MQRSLRLLVALLALAVMQNGVMASPVVPEPIQDATGHSQHDHSGTKGHDSSRHAPDTGDRDCCISGDCDCGCTVTSPAAVFRPAPTAHDWGRIAAVRAEDSTGDLPGVTGAPFRPPA